MYEWKYFYDGDEQEYFDSVIYMGKGDIVIIMNILYDGIIYVWYWFIDGD